MDNFLIFMIIFGAFLWWDCRKRDNAIKQAWNNIGIKEGTIVTVPVERTMTEEDYLTTLNELLDDQDDTPEKLNVDDETHMHELVNDLLKEMPVEEMDDARAALKSLGYKNTDINKAMGEIINTVGNTAKSGEIVTSALRILNA